MLNLETDIRPLSEFRADAAGFLERMRETRQALVLTQHGRSSAVILSVAEYQRLIDELELLRAVHLGIVQSEADEVFDHDEAEQLALARFA